MKSKDFFKRKIFIWIHKNIANDSPIRRNAKNAIPFIISQFILATLTYKNKSALLFVFISNFLLYVRVQFPSVKRLELKVNRKTLTAGILGRIQKYIIHPNIVNDDKLLKLRNDILCAISSNVANYFLDNEKSVTASLVVEDLNNQEKMIVIASSNEARDILRKAEKSDCLGWRAMQLKEVQSTGDIDEEFKRLCEKKYKSVLSIPLLDENKNALAAINIDYKKKYSFSEREHDFETNLRPYSKLLLMSLILF